MHFVYLSEKAGFMHYTKSLPKNIAPQQTVFTVAGKF